MNVIIEPTNTETNESQTTQRLLGHKGENPTVTTNQPLLGHMGENPTAKNQTLLGHKGENPMANNQTLLGHKGENPTANNQTLLGHEGENPTANNQMLLGHLGENPTVTATDKNTQNLIDAISANFTSVYKVRCLNLNKFSRFTITNCN